VSICDEKMYEIAATSLEKISLLSFHSDIKINDFAELLAAVLILIVDKKLARQKARMEEYLKFCA
jgi:hypothetical protein